MRQITKNTTKREFGGNSESGSDNMEDSGNSNELDNRRTLQSDNVILQSNKDILLNRYLLASGNEKDDLLQQMNKIDMKIKNNKSLMCIELNVLDARMDRQCDNDILKVMRRRQFDTQQSNMKNNFKLTKSMKKTSQRGSYRVKRRNQRSGKKRCTKSKLYQ